MSEKASAGLIVALAGILMWAASSGIDPSLAHRNVNGYAAQGAGSPLLQYQGLLTDRGTGEPVVDGHYTITLGLYDVETGGSPLWMETKVTPVQNGVFSTMLGDETPLDQNLFNGQALWLGVEIDADGEAEPRQRIVPVAYALSLAPGAVVSATSESPLLTLGNAGNGPALQVEGDLNVSGDLVGGAHAHSGADIATGTVAEHFIDARIARDDEITPTVLGADGTGSGLDADLLDGQDSGQFAATDHDHDNRYYSQTDSDGRFVNTEGPETVTGSSLDPMLEVTQMGGGVAGAFISANAHGVLGETDSDAQGQAGVLGVAGWTELTPGYPAGVLGQSLNGIGVAGMSEENIGVLGRSQGSTGVYGRSYSDANAAVVGQNSAEGDGVRGLAEGAGTGVFGYSDYGYGGHFIGSGWDALHVDGRTEMNGSLAVSGNVQVSGPLAVSSDVEAKRVVYSAPRTHYFVVGSEGFVPGSNVDYVNTDDQEGGAYVNTLGSHALVAPVHLPQGAEVTAFEAFLYDSSTSDMTVTLRGQSLDAAGYSEMAHVSSSGTSGYDSQIDTTIENALIDNTVSSYNVYAHSSSWDGHNLRIKGALITYTISEAP